jgi:hypothetical protein
MKRIHTQSRKGRRGHKYFPDSRFRLRIPPASMIPAFIAALLGRTR